MCVEAELQSSYSAMADVKTADNENVEGGGQRSSCHVVEKTNYNDYVHVPERGNCSLASA